VAAVYRAISGASAYVPAALYQATGYELQQVLASILPGLLLMLGVLAATTAFGTVVGAAVGALAFGAGAAPGAVAGAGLGLEAGMAIVDYLGLGFLAAYIVKALAQATHTAVQAAEIAWKSPQYPAGPKAAEQAASELFARAVVQVMQGVLQGVVAFLLAKGVGLAATRVAELSNKLRASKLGVSFAQWVETHWADLVRNPRLKDIRSPRTASAAGGSTDSGGAAAVKKVPVAAPAAAVPTVTSFDHIKAIPKGSRPDPHTYMSDAQIREQLSQFDAGATRFTTQGTLDKYGPAQRDGTSFVMPKSEADELLASTKGDNRALENALGLPNGLLDSQQLVRVDVPDPASLNLRIPSGNEAGANDQWIPGGKLPDGNLEAVVDLGGASPGSWTATPLN
jgi:hypothetical protein